MLMFLTFFLGLGYVLLEFVWLFGLQPLVGEIKKARNGLHVQQTDGVLLRLFLGEGPFWVPLDQGLNASDTHSLRSLTWVENP